METTGLNKRIHRICVESTMKKWPSQRNVALEDSRNQNDGVGSVKGTSMKAYTVQMLRAWYGSDSQNPLPADGGEGMGNGEWSSSSVPADRACLRRNELPRETQSMSGEREKKLTVYPVMQLAVLACRFVGTTRVCHYRFFDSIVPSIVRASGKHRVVAGTVKASSI